MVRRLLCVEWHAATETTSAFALSLRLEQLQARLPEVAFVLRHISVLSLAVFSNVYVPKNKVVAHHGSEMLN